MADHKDAVIESLQKVSISKDYADITFVAPDGQEIQAHRVIVCPRSSVIKAMVDGPFQESKTLRIEPKLFQYAELKRMVDYLYTSDYYFSKGTKFDLTEHVLVFQIADYYDIPLLKALAIEKMAVCTFSLKNHRTAMELAYDCTNPTTGRELRDFMCETFAENSEEILGAKGERERWKQVLLEHEDLAFELVFGLLEYIKKDKEAITKFAEHRDEYIKTTEEKLKVRNAVIEKRGKLIELLLKDKYGLSNQCQTCGNNTSGTIEFTKSSQQVVYKCGFSGCTDRFAITHAPE